MATEVVQVSTIRDIVVAESAIPDLEKIVRRFVRAAKRLGLVPEPRLEIDWATRHEVPQRHATDKDVDYLVPVVTAHLHLPDTGSIQAVGNWRVLGSLTKTDEGLEANAFSAASLPSVASYRDRNQMECDHCHANRSRSKTFVICDDAGTTKQVGRECVHAYVDDLAQVVGALEFQELVAVLLGNDGNAIEYGFNGARVLRAFDAMEALVEICACIRVDGRYFPSKRLVGDYYTPNPDATWRAVVRRLIEHTARSYPLAVEDTEQARELMTWLGTVETKDDDFLAALKDVATVGFVSERKMALWAALPIAKEHHDRAANPPVTPAPEGRQLVEGAVISVKEIEGFNGGPPVFKMLVELADRNRVYASVPRGLNATALVRGTPVKFKATFKRSDSDLHFAFGTHPKLA